MRSAPRLLLVILSAATLTAVIGCRQDSTYTLTPVPRTIDNAGAQRAQFVTLQGDLTALQTALDEHAADYERSRSAGDPLNPDEARTASAEILKAADALEERAQAALATEKIVAEVEGARETFQQYLDHARETRQKYAPPAQ